MKQLIGLILGLAVGGVCALAFLYYNPLTSQDSLSPLSVSRGEQFSLVYSAVAEDSIVFTNDGESRRHPHPVKVLQLWEAPIRQTDVLVTMLRDSRNLPTGIGIKFSSQSERTRLLNGEAMVDSVWHVYLPGRGTLMIEQSENYWSYLRDIVIPAHWSSGDSWRGNWRGTVTDGPGALGTARVYGGSGAFSGADFEAIETLTAEAWSTKDGAVAVEGQILFEMPSGTAEVVADPNGR